MFITKGFSPEEIVLFDQSRFLINASGNYTYEAIGSRRVLARNAGNRKVSVCGLFSSTMAAK